MFIQYVISVSNNLNLLPLDCYSISVGLFIYLMLSRWATTNINPLMTVNTVSSFTSKIILCLRIAIINKNKPKPAKEIYL